MLLIGSLKPLQKERLRSPNKDSSFLPPLRTCVREIRNGYYRRMMKHTNGGEYNDEK